MDYTERHTPKSKRKIAEDDKKKTVPNASSNTHKPPSGTASDKGYVALETPTPDSDLEGRGSRAEAKNGEKTPTHRICEGVSGSDNERNRRDTSAGAIDEDTPRSRQNPRRADGGGVGWWKKIEGIREQGSGEGRSCKHENLKQLLQVSCDA